MTQIYILYIYIVAGLYICVYIYTHDEIHVCPFQPFLNDPFIQDAGTTGAQVVLQITCRQRKKKILNKSQAGKQIYPRWLTAGTWKWWFGSDDVPFQTGEILSWTMFNFQGWYPIASAAFASGDKPRLCYMNVIVFPFSWRGWNKHLLFGVCFFFGWCFRGTNNS